MNIYTTSNRIAINNQSRFIPMKTSALLFSLICILTLAACAGGGGGGGGSTPEGKPNPPPAGIGVLNLRVIPNDTNATLIWNNPDVNITSINITYHNKSTPDALQYFPLITEEDSISSNATNVTKVITNLEEGSIYIFNVRLELGGADENRTVNRELSMMRLIGPNLDQDEYADDDPRELDKDGDGVNDNLDAFPRNTTLSAFMVTELSARSGNGEVTLSWTNPVANISSISISYHNTNAPNDLQHHPLIEDSPRTNSSATNVEETIDGLVNGQSYNFTVRLILDRDDAGKKVVVASTTATPGAFSVIDLTAVPGAGNVTLNWNNPDADIASISIRYGITGSSASTTVGASNTGRGASVEQTIGGLMNGESYTFTVSLTLTGTDAGREGVAPSATATPNVFSVTDLVATPGAGNVTLSWNNPDADIASISISYEREDSMGTTMMKSSTQIIPGAENVKETIDGLDNEVSYIFTVSLTLTGTDTGREGEAVSDIATPNVFSVTDLTAVPNDRSVTLSWNNPDADIASISISYEVTGSGASTTVEASNTVRNASVEQTIDGLDNGVSYTFTVSLTLREDDAGREGDAPSTTAIPGTFSVIDLLATPGNGNVTLSWINPDADIASISISYEVTGSGASTTAEASNISRGASVEQTIDGLMNGRPYTFTVSLTLQNDDVGKEGVPPFATAIPDDFSVTDLVATPGAGNVTLRWTNPAANISSISIRYGITGSSEFTIVGASNTGRRASVEQTITGLTNGVPYNFTVSLTLQNDDAGREGEAVSDTATPNVFSVTGLTAIPNDRSVTLSWNNPDADIASISISYEIDGSGASTTVEAGNTGRVASVEQTIDGLTNEEYYDFTVSLTLTNADTGREGPAESIRVGIGPNLDGDVLADFEDNDIDGDNTLNSADVDDDGDGLIEISTAEQLNQVRYNLLGSSLKASDGVAGDANGCGGLNGISDCNGYELTQNISLDGYNSDRWVPIGSCPTSTNFVCTNVGVLFNTTFDGNGYIISNLTITNPGGDYANAAGLFGAISPDSILRNIHLRSANLSGGGTKVGLLVGYAREAMISNSSAEGDVAASGADVGGLVGLGNDITITSSYAEVGSVIGSGQVGGLVGVGDSATIMSSYAEVGTIIGPDNYAGGLVGLGNDITITSSYAETGAISGSHNIGGLVGGGNSATITSSYAETGAISGSSGIFGRIGGLVGTGNSVTIMSSYAVTGPLSSASSENTLGGLVGDGNLNSASSNSYWNNETSGITGGSVAGKSEGKTTDELQIPTDFIGIYATWATDMCDDGTDTWDLGLDDQYPALNCTPGGVDAQRP